MLSSSPKIKGDFQLILSGFDFMTRSNWNCCSGQTPDRGWWTEFFRWVTVFSRSSFKYFLNHYLMWQQMACLSVKSKAYGRLFSIVTCHLSCSIYISRGKIIQVMIPYFIFSHNQYIILKYYVFEISKRLYRTSLLGGTKQTNSETQMVDLKQIVLRKIFILKVNLIDSKA